MLPLFFSFYFYFFLLFFFLTFTLPLLAGFPFALFHRKFLYGKSPVSQHSYFIACGVAIGFWNYGNLVQNKLNSLKRMNMQTIVENSISIQFQNGVFCIRRRLCSSPTWYLKFSEVPRFRSSSRSPSTWDIFYWVKKEKMILEQQRPIRVINCTRNNEKEYF